VRNGYSGALRERPADGLLDERVSLRGAEGGHGVLRRVVCRVCVRACVCAVASQQAAGGGGADVRCGLYPPLPLSHKAPLLQHTPTSLASFHKAPHLQVHGRRGLVQHKDARLLEHAARHAHQLLLAQRKVAAALGHVAVQAAQVRHGLRATHKNARTHTTGPSHISRWAPRPGASSRGLRTHHRLWPERLKPCPPGPNLQCCAP
jgi:hypothetical protein